jgi:hypothetical protein
MKLIYPSVKINKNGTWSIRSTNRSQIEQQHLLDYDNEKKEGGKKKRKIKAEELEEMDFAREEETRLRSLEDKNWALRNGLSGKGEVRWKPFDWVGGGGDEGGGSGGGVTVGIVHDLVLVNGEVEIKKKK